MVIFSLNWAFKKLRGDKAQARNEQSNNEKKGLETERGRGGPGKYRSDPLAQEHRGREQRESRAAGARREFGRTSLQRVMEHVKVESGDHEEECHADRSERQGDAEIGEPRYRSARAHHI